MKAREWINRAIINNGPLKTYIFVLFLFIALSLVFTYPLVLSMTSAFPGAGDIPQMAWYFWLTSKMNVLSGGFHTTYIFYPDGIEMISLGTAYNQLLSLVMVPLMGSTLTLNILYLSAFILSGFGAYLLARHVTRDDAASVIAGIIYTFAPYHFAHAYAGHLGSVTMQWIPFCTLFLVKMFEEKKLSYAILASIFFILVAMSDLQYMVFMGIFVILFIIYGLLNRSIKANKNTLALIIIFGIISFIGILPLTFNLISASLSPHNYLTPDSDEAKFFSNDLLSFFVPAYFHPILGGLATSLFYKNTAAGNLTPWEITSYIGISVLLLSLYAAFKDTGKKYLFWAQTFLRDKSCLLLLLL